jgi:hypothetical protein
VLRENENAVMKMIEGLFKKNTPIKVGSKRVRNQVEDESFAPEVEEPATKKPCLTQES